MYLKSGIGIGYESGLEIIEMNSNEFPLVYQFIPIYPSFDFALVLAFSHDTSVLVALQLYTTTVLRLLFLRKTWSYQFAMSLLDLHVHLLSSIITSRRVSY